MARVLFIDDDPLTLETLTRAIQLYGHESLQAVSGKAGLALAAENSPDLIFMDMSLSDVGGLMLLQTLKSQAATADIPVFVLSAGPETDYAEQVKQAGARDYISKPVRLQTLLDIIDEIAAK